MSGYPTSWPEITTLDETMEMYTQRPKQVDPPANRRFSLATLRDWLKSAMSKLFFRADGPDGANEYEFTLGGAFYWKGQKGLETHLDGNRIYIRPKMDAPADGQVWTYNATLEEMILADPVQDLHTRIEISTAAAVWNLPHNLGFVPNYIAKDTSGNILNGMRETVDNNNERITFGTARAGYVDFT